MGLFLLAYPVYSNEINNIGTLGSGTCTKLISENTLTLVKCT